MLPKLNSKQQQQKNKAKTQNNKKRKIYTFPPT